MNNDDLDNSAEALGPPPKAEDDITGYSDHFRKRFGNQKWPDDYVSMAHGNPGRFPFQPSVEQAQTELTRREIMSHYHGSGVLYNAESCITDYNSYMHEIGIEKELSKKNYVPTNGGTHAYTLAVEQLLDDNDVLLIPTPTYGFFIDPRNLKHTNTEALQLRAEDGYKLTPELLDSEITRINKQYEEQGSKKRVSAFLNINPSNPTGVVYTKDDLEPIADVLKKHDIKLVIDDLAYMGTEYARNSKKEHKNDDVDSDISRLAESIKGLAQDKHKPNNFAAPMASIDGMFDRTLSIFSLSKAYSLAAIRSGLAVGPKKFVAPIKKEIGRRAEFLPNASQVAMLRAFKEPEERKQYLERQAEKFEFNYNLVRVLINGWDNDPEAQSFFKAQNIDNASALADKIYPTHLLESAPIELGDFQGLSGVNGHAMIDFDEWLETHDDLGEEERSAIAEASFFLVTGREDEIKEPHNTEEIIERTNNLIIEFNEQALQKAENSPEKKELINMLNHPGKGLKALPITQAGFFAAIDATELKGKRAWSQLLEDAGDVSKEMLEGSGVSLLGGEAMGNHDDKLILRLTFSDRPDDIVKGAKRIRHFLSRINTIPDDTLTTLEAMKRGGSEQRSATEALLHERFGGASEQVQR